MNDKLGQTVISCVFVFLTGCSSLSGSSRDAFAPYVELSKPKTVNNVIVGGSDPYSASVPHALAASTPQVTTQTAPAISVNAGSRAAAQQMIYSAVKEQCGESGVMGPVEFVNGQWVSRVQCGSVTGSIPTPSNNVPLWQQ